MNLLMLACKKSKKHVVRALLDKPNVQVYHRDQNGRNAVHYAIENIDEAEAKSIMRLLFDEYPQLVAKIL
jgi:ankyrin repeat protein